MCVFTELTCFQDYIVVCKKYTYDLHIITCSLCITDRKDNLTYIYIIVGQTYCTKSMQIPQSWIQKKIMVLGMCFLSFMKYGKAIYCQYLVLLSSFHWQEIELGRCPSRLVYWHHNYFVKWLTIFDRLVRIDSLKRIHN